MKKIIDSNIVEQAIWAQDQVESNPFSQIDITFVVHDGKIARIKKGIAVQVKPDDPAEPVLNVLGGLAS